jgi:hypothetical protein
MSSQNELYIKRLEETNELLEKKLNEFKQTPHPECEKLTIRVNIDTTMTRVSNMDIVRDKIERQMAYELGKRMKIVSFVEQYTGVTCYQAEIWVMKDLE